MLIVLTNEDGSSNTVTVGTLLYPPQLAWFANDNPKPENYINQEEKIHLLNGKIDRLNIGHGMEHYMGVHKYGVRVSNIKWQDPYGRQLVKHRWEHWRESDKRNIAPDQ